MQRYLLVGFFCTMFWLFLEPQLYRVLFFVRYQLFSGNKVEMPPRNDGLFQMFFTGATAALIMVLWPAYVLMTIGKFASLIFGRERLTHS